MKLNLSVEITDDVLMIRSDDFDYQIEVHDTNKIGKKAQGVNLLWQERHLVGITASETPKLDVSFDQIMTVIGDWDFEPDYLALKLAEVAQEAGNDLVVETQKAKKLPASQSAIMAKITDQLQFILSQFGYSVAVKKAAPAKKKPAKAQHRWNKAVSDIDFFVDYAGSQATARWIKRNEMLIKKGAKMAPDAPLNKDGSLGFSARFAQKLRDEHANQFENFTTTEDIILKSVNEVGLFLYFAGANGWLILKDSNGKTIDEYTVVN